MKKLLSILTPILLLGLIFVASQLLMAITIRSMGLIDADGGVTDFGFFLSYTLSMGITLGLLILIERGMYGKIGKIDRKSAGFDPVAILLGLIVIVATSILLMPLAKVLPERGIEVGDGTFMLITIVLIAPIIEEVIFRGRLYGILRHNSSPLLAATLSALTFGAIHLSPIVVIEGFLAGFVFSYFYIIKRSIIAPILLHMCNNAMAYALIVLSYNDESVMDIFGGQSYFIFVYIAAAIIVVTAASIMITRLVKEKRRIASSTDVEIATQAETQE